jgi:hypothetical protein
MTIDDAMPWNAVSDDEEPLLSESDPMIPTGLGDFYEIEDAPLVPRAMPSGSRYPGRARIAIERHRLVIDKGQVYKLDRSGLTVVVSRITSSGTFDCIVVAAPEGSSYPVGGHDISVSEQELRSDAYQIDMSC